MNERVRALRGMLKGDEIEAVYASNALEGNSLTLGETSLVAIDHREALRYVRDIATRPEPFDERTLRELHARVLRRSDPEDAGLSRVRCLAVPRTAKRRMAAPFARRGTPPRRSTERLSAQRR